MHRSTQNLVEEALSIARYMKYACAPQLIFFCRISDPLYTKIQGSRKMTHLCFHDHPDFHPPLL